MKDMECAKSGNTLKEPWTKSRLAVCCRPQDEILCIFFTEAQLKWWKIAFGSLKWWVFRWLVLVGLGNHAGRTVSQPPSTNSCFTIGSEFKVYLSEAAAAAEYWAHFPVSHIMTTTTTELVACCRLHSHTLIIWTENLLISSFLIISSYVCKYIFLWQIY